jgi:hypothetical protein
MSAPSRIFLNKLRDRKGLRPDSWASNFLLRDRVTLWFQVWLRRKAIDHAVCLVHILFKLCTRQCCGLYVLCSTSRVELPGNLARRLSSIRLTLTKLGYNSISLPSVDVVLRPMIPLRC